MHDDRKRRKKGGSRIVDQHCAGQNRKEHHVAVQLPPLSCQRCRQHESLPNQSKADADRRMLFIHSKRNRAHDGEKGSPDQQWQNRVSNK
ncbi:hypothetical protein [Loktanella sp. R86503]|uniref:hypothetical protein n=1 Tax=Loktanella sp. R86503 TaxID=3093847 RepID=UPI0036DD976B